MASKEQRPYQRSLYGFNFSGSQRSPFTWPEFRVQLNGSHALTMQFDDTVVERSKYPLYLMIAAFINGESGFPGFQPFQLSWLGGERFWLEIDPLLKGGGILGGDGILRFHKIPFGLL